MPSVTAPLSDYFSQTQVRFIWQRALNAPAAGIGVRMSESLSRIRHYARVVRKSLNKLPRQALAASGGDPEGEDGMAAKKKKINPKFEPYKKLLLKIKEQITGDIHGLSDENNGSGNDRGGDVSGHALHMADVATDMYDREFTLGLAANDRELLVSCE